VNDAMRHMNQFIKKSLIKIAQKLEEKEKEVIRDRITKISDDSITNMTDLEEIRNSETEVYLSEYYEKRYLQNYGLLNISDYQSIHKFATMSPSIEDVIVSEYFSAPEVSKIYHYTSFESLLKIVQSKRIRMSCISSLNDKNEMTSTEALSRKTVIEPYHYKRIEAFNRRYVLSCSLLKDNLNQWRLYGDDGKGVSIEFKINKEKIKEPFYIGKIFYGYNILIAMQKLVEKVYKSFGVVLILRSFNVWNSFIKSTDYQYEKEIRLLYWSRGTSPIETTWSLNGYGILSKYASFDNADFPIAMSGITLGPKLNEPELNRGQIKQYLRESGLTRRINVEVSKIFHYR